MSTRELLEPIVEQGILNPHFFEGRLLSAQDLRDQQWAVRAHDRLLGRALGPGIVEGLEVTLEDSGGIGRSPVVKVSTGLAINRLGEAIGFEKEDIHLALVRFQPEAPPADKLFFLCKGPPRTQHLPNGAGVYVLVMAPANDYLGQAPKSGLGQGGVARGCGDRYVREGVQFRYVKLEPDKLQGASEATRDLLRNDLLSPNDPARRDQPARLSRLRNLLAHLCFGTEGRLRRTADPLGPETGAGLGALDELRDAGCLDACDVPLALFYWTLQGVAFCDPWSVRRRSARPRVGTDRALFPAVGEDPRSEAVLLQFQDQIQWLVSIHPDPRDIVAVDCFYRLPPAGMLPFHTGEGPSGVDDLVFFQRMKTRPPVYMEGEQLFPLLRDSLAFQPFEPDRGEAVFVYLVRENRVLAEQRDAVTSLLVFSHCELGNRGLAKFDLNYWDYANFA